MRALPEISLLRHLHTGQIAIAAALGLLLDLAAVLLALLALSRDLSCHCEIAVKPGIAWRGEHRDFEAPKTRKSEVCWRRNNLRGPFPPPLQGCDPPKLGLLILSVHLLFFLFTINILDARIY